MGGKIVWSGLKGFLLSKGPMGGGQNLFQGPKRILSPGGGANFYFA